VQSTVSTLSVRRSNGAAGGPTRPYSASGWLELRYQPRGSGRGTFSVTLLNITGELVTTTESLPSTVHIASREPGSSSHPVANGRAHGTLSIPASITYPELTRDDVKKIRALPGYVPPIASALSVSFQLDLGKRTLRLGGAALLEALPPVVPARVIVFADITCTLAPLEYCKTMCLDIKVGKDDKGQPSYTEQQIKDIVKKVNNIWGCTLKGQCCIQLKVKRIAPPNASIKAKLVTKLWEESADLKDTVGIDRSSDPKCYNLYFVHDAGQPLQAGQTKYGDLSGSVIGHVTATGANYDDDTIALFTGHELGHALGLAPNKADDPEGVTGHSTKKNNVMGGSGLGKELNAKQCKAARKSGWLIVTESRCNPGPWE
jgi:hypothetical protein